MRDTILRTIDVVLPLDQLTNRQLHLYLIGLIERQTAVLDQVEGFMADLTSSVADLQAAVDNMAVRFASQLVPLQEALTDAQARVSELELEDESQVQALNEALASASSAADAIEAEVAELNSIGAEPDVPVETVPVEELPPPPSEESTDGTESTEGTPTEETPAP